MMMMMKCLFFCFLTITIVSATTKGHNDHLQRQAPATVNEYDQGFTRQLKTTKKSKNPIVVPYVVTGDAYEVTGTDYSDTSTTETISANVSKGKFHSVDVTSHALAHSPSKPDTKGFLTSTTHNIFIAIGVCIVAGIFGISLFIKLSNKRGEEDEEILLVKEQLQPLSDDDSDSEQHKQEYYLYLSMKKQKLLSNNVDSDLEQPRQNLSKKAVGGRGSFSVLNKNNKQEETPIWSIRYSEGSSPNNEKKKMGAQAPPPEVFNLSLNL
jgi:hypothetical protein